MMMKLYVPCLGLFKLYEILLNEISFYVKHHFHILQK